MKAVILHGGYGTRLRPLTFTRPKQLIPIANKPISQYVLEDIRTSRISDVAIVLGNVFAERVREHYGDGSNFGVRITYVEQGEPRGIAHAVGLCSEFIGKDRFVLYLGDNLLKGGIEKFVERFDSEESLDALVVLTAVKEPQRFGVARFDEKGTLVELIEKPKVPPSNYAIAGIYFFTPLIFDAIKRLKPSWRGELEITEAIQILLNEGNNVAYDFIEGWWKDTGSAEDIIEANRLVLDEQKPEQRGAAEDDSSIQGRVSLGDGSIIKRGAMVKGPAAIGKGTIIESGVYVGPYTSIGDRCRVLRGEMVNSIIMDDSTIDVDDRITDSLIGPNCVIVCRSDSKPMARRLIVGDSSQVIL